MNHRDTEGTENGQGPMANGQRERVGKWLRASGGEPIPGRATVEWKIVCADGVTRLGAVRWFNSWRRYSFFPEPGRVFDAACLRDIADFCERKTTERKEARRG